MTKLILAADKIMLLLSLVPYLREHGPTPLSELSATFDVDQNQLRTLIEFLGTAGLPGETLSYQHNDLFDIDWDDLELNDSVSLTQTVAIDETPRFTGVETAALLAGLQALKPLLSDEDATLAEALGKRLGEAMGAHEVPAVVVTQPGETGVTALLVAAIESGERISFEYRDATGQVTRRTVSPERLWEREGVWYLHGYNEERDAHRTFSVSQMRVVERLGAGAGAGSGADSGADTGAGEASGATKRAAADREIVTELIAIVPERLIGRIRGFAPEEITNPASLGLAGRVPDGAVLVRIEAWHAGAAVRLAQHGPGEIEIISPLSARAAVSEWAEAALSAYGA